MENSTKSLKRQLSLNESKLRWHEDAKVNTETDIIYNNNNINNCNNDSINGATVTTNQQIRNNLSVNEVKFSDFNYKKCTPSNSKTKLNNGCYTVRGRLNDINGGKNRFDYINEMLNGGSKLKLNKNARSLDEESFTSASTTVTTTVLTKKKPKIPDGGFGWVIVLASFVISMIIDGIAFSFGLIYTELLHYFKQSKTKTSWIGAFHLSVPLLAGPIISNLVDKYGCRITTIIGGLISGIGFVLSAMSNSVEMLYLTFGLISGFGIGMGYVTAVVSIAFWFDKKRKCRKCV